MLTIHEQTVWHVILIIVIIKYDNLSINMSEIIYEFHHFWLTIAYIQDVWQSSFQTQLNVLAWSYSF